jgi:hypothetical protein
MNANPRGKPIDSITNGWIFLVALCTSPLFLLFIYFGERGRGAIAWLCGTAIVIIGRFLWYARTHAWYWLTLTAIVLLHVPVIALMPWPVMQLSPIGFLPLAVADLGLDYWLLKLAERIFGRDESMPPG